MATKMLGGQEIEIDEDGFIQEPDKWTEAVAEDLGKDVVREQRLPVAVNQYALDRPLHQIAKTLLAVPQGGLGPIALPDVAVNPDDTAPANAVFTTEKTSPIGPLVLTTQLALPMLLQPTLHPWLTVCCALCRQNLFRRTLDQFPKFGPQFDR